MSLIWIQTCDGCGTTRELTQRDPIPQKEGWREVDNNKHLCAQCIFKALRHVKVSIGSGPCVCAQCSAKARSQVEPIREC